MWQNPKTQVVTNIKNPYCDKTKKFKSWQNSKKMKKTQKLKLGKNLKYSNCDNSKTQIVTKLKNLMVTKKEKIKPNCDKTPKFKLWQISKTQIVTKL